jgi:hypothetical protein
MSVLSRLNPDNSVYDLYPVLNNNMDIVEAFLETFDLMIDSSTGDINLSPYPSAKVIAKELVIPVGNSGVTVGNTTITDSVITTKQVISDANIKAATSTQYVLLTNNMIDGDGGYLTVSPTVSTLTMNPTQNLLSFELAQSVGSIRQCITLVNLSANNSVVKLVNNNYMIHADFTEASIPFGANLKLEYINDSNLTIEGWIIVSEYGVTFA